MAFNLKNISEKLRDYFARRVPGSQQFGQAWKSPAGQQAKSYARQIIQPTIQTFKQGFPAAGRASARSNPFIRLQSRFNPKIAKETAYQKGDVFKMARLGATGFGLTKLKPIGALAMGGLSGGLSKITGGKFGEGVARGIGQYPQIAGVIGATNPLLAKIMPAGWGKVGTSGAGSLANAAQGLGIDIATKQPTTPASIGLDVLTGAVGGKGQFRGVKGIKGKVKFKPTLPAKPKAKEVIPEESLNMIKQALFYKEDNAARQLYKDLSKQYKLPKFQDISEGIIKEQKQYVKNVDYDPIGDKFGKYRDEVRKHINTLKLAGEKKSKKTGMLFRETIPATDKYMSSDEMASAMKMSENEYMEYIVGKAGRMGEARIKPEEIKVIKQQFKKIKHWWDKLDKKDFQVIKDWENNVQATLVQPGKEGLEKIAKRDQVAAKKTIQQDFAEWQKSYRQQTITPSQRLNKQLGDISGAIRQQTSSAGSKVEEMKDISGFYAGWRDVYRNFKAVYGKGFSKIKKVVLDPFDESKGRFVDMQKQYVDDLDTTIVKKLNIKKGSQESRLVQNFGEGKIKLEELQKQQPKKWQNIVEADKWFRQKYDELLDTVNAVRTKVYPNNPDKIIPKRKDYYRHFQEMAQGFKGLKNIFDTPAMISSKLSGVSEFTKPKSKWLSFAQKRLGMDTTEDAVGGFIDYIKSASYATHIDPNIPKFRGLAEELALKTESGESTGKLNNFIEFLQDFSNDLSGKTNPIDRTFQKWVPGGRTTFRAINWLNNRVKANVILGNASSSLAQIFNVPQGIANAGLVNSTKGMGDSLASIFAKNQPMAKSNFIKERYAYNIYNKFDTSMLAKTKNFSAWMIGALDEVGTKYIWNSHYRKALADGIPDGVKYSDDITRKMVAGRGVGEVPLAQKSRVTQLIAPFQLEVGNLWHVMGDFVGEKAFGKLALLFVANHLFNKAAEKIRGSAVSFDPIQAMSDALQPDQTPLQRGGRLAGEVLSNIPLGQTAAAAYPEYGMKAAGIELPTRKKFFGREDPTRFGGGALFVKGLQDPLYKVLPAFGGGQIKKTISGAKLLSKGYSETPSDKIRFLKPESTIGKAKSVLFGEYGTPQAREYFDKNRKPLGEKQTEKFKILGKDYYNKIIAGREAKAYSKEAENKQISALSGGKLEKYAISLGFDKYQSPPSGAVAKAKWEDDKFKDAVKVFRDDDLDEQTKQSLIISIKETPEDIAYYDIAAGARAVRRAAIDEVISTVDRKDLVNSLAEFRREVHSKKILTNTVITDLVNEGILAYSEGEQLKNLKIVNGKSILKGKSKKAKKGKTISIKKTTFKPYAFKIKTSKGKVNLPSLKITERPKLKFTKRRKADILKVIK